MKPLRFPSILRFASILRITSILVDLSTPSQFADNFELKLSTPNSQYPNTTSTMVKASETSVSLMRENLKFKTDGDNGIPYFASTVPCDTPRLAVGGREDLESLLYTIGHKNDINLLSTSDLVTLGMFCASVDSRPTISATYEFVHRAAIDCVIALKRRIAASKCDRTSPIGSLALPGRAIAAAIDYAIIRSVKCYGLHELVFNGIIGLLHGEIGSTLDNVVTRGEGFWEYRFSELELAEDYSDNHFLTYEPDSVDDLSFVQFLPTPFGPLPEQNRQISLASPGNRKRRSSLASHTSNKKISAKKTKTTPKRTITSEEEN